MTYRPSVLCPIDFSGSSRGALRYAVAIAAHFGAQLTVLAVNDPLLQEAHDFAGVAHLSDDTMRDLKRFLDQTTASLPHRASNVELVVATGKPAPEILRVSLEKHCDLIVMSSHGLTGFRKMFFGSTAERVLRETTMPVLVTPGTDPGPNRLEDVKQTVRRVMAPVDLTAASADQIRVVQALGDALDVPVLLLHVVEPIRGAVSAAHWLPKVEAERRYRAEQDLERAVAGLAGDRKVEALIAYGEPAEEIAKVASDREAALIVMGLHSSPVLGPRMGSVTYRVLCLAHRLVLALPPRPAAPATDGS